MGLLLWKTEMSLLAGWALNGGPQQVGWAGPCYEDLITAALDWAPGVWLWKGSCYSLPWEGVSFAALGHLEVIMASAWVHPSLSA